MEDDAALAGLVEVQPLPCHDVEEVVDAERAQLRYLQVVRAGKTFLVAEHPYGEVDALVAPR